jgi:hypothetical protein
MTLQTGIKAFTIHIRGHIKVLSRGYCRQINGMSYQAEGHPELTPSKAIFMCSVWAPVLEENDIEIPNTPG